MIKFETNKGKSTIEIKGTTEELLADITSFLQGFITSIEEDDKDVAEYVRWVFKNHLMDIVLEEKSSTEIIKEEEEKRAKQVAELINGLDDDIKKLLEAIKNK